VTESSSRPGADDLGNLTSLLCTNEAVKTEVIAALKEYGVDNPTDSLAWELLRRIEIAAANDLAARSKVLQIGDPDDGGIYVGRSAEDGKPLHAALADEPKYLTYEDALAAADQLKALHPSAHVPTPRELDKNLFANRNIGHLKGTFNTSGRNPGSVYRSSASYDIDVARVQWFADGGQDGLLRDGRLPVRPVW
jgi:hypothetical protein